MIILHNEILEIKKKYCFLKMCYLKELKDKVVEIRINKPMIGKKSEEKLYAKGEM